MGSPSFVRCSCGCSYGCSYGREPTTRRARQPSGCAALSLSFSYSLALFASLALAPSLLVCGARAWHGVCGTQTQMHNAHSLPQNYRPAPEDLPAASGRASSPLALHVALCLKTIPPTAPALPFFSAPGRASTYCLLIDVCHVISFVHSSWRVGRGVGSTSSRGGQALRRHWGLLAAGGPRSVACRQSRRGEVL